MNLTLRSMARVISYLVVLMTMTTPGPAQDRGFSNERSTRHYTRSRTFDVRHLKLDLSFDHERGMVMGTATTTLTPINDGLKQVVLDAVDLSIEAVNLVATIPVGSATRRGNRRLDFAVENDQLIIDLDRAYQSGETVIIEVAYHGQPKMGLYFVRPDEDYPDKPWQIWSQGEMEESRHWYPGYDSPNERMTTEMIVTVPQGQRAISNGALLATRENKNDGTVTYHWKESVPHVNYLVSLVVGEFVELRDEWEGVPILYYMEPKYRDQAELALGRTPDMMAYYSDIIGIKYPYEKYAQTTITDFMWGGMENISATTLNTRIYHDERAHLDYTSDGLIAHELVHQWFGNLLTTKNWNHIWLNEAFATYFDALYVEHDKGPQEFIMELEANRAEYFDEDSASYRRPIVTNLYEDPEQMFDRHTYQKGSLVLHMVRYLLGEELWWKAIRHYAQAHAGETVETNDFKQAIEDATGRAMEGFFDQWLYRGGHPEYEVAWKWDRKRSAVALNVKQVQQVDEVTPLFRMPVEVAMTGTYGTRTATIDVRRAEETFYLPVPAKPTRVEFDPHDWVLKELRFEKSQKEWLDQLANAGDTGRMRAAGGLAEYTNKKASRELGNALQNDPFRGVRAKAAEALGKIRTKTARDGLLAGLQDSHAHVRRAVITALGHYIGDEKVASALEDIFYGDPSYYAQATAISALARLETGQAYDLSLEALDRRSHREVIRDSAFIALGSLKDPRGIDIALTWSEYGRPIVARTAAIRALAQLASTAPKRGSEIRERLIALLTDNHFKARIAAMKALGKLGDPHAVPALEASMAREAHFNRRDEARKALKKISDRNSD